MHHRSDPAVPARTPRGRFLQRRPTSASAWLAAALAAAFAGLLLAAGWLSDSSLAWPVYLLTGIAAGMIAGRGRHIWLVWLAAAAVYPAALALDLPAGQDAPAWWAWSRQLWFLLTIVGTCVATAGFAVGAVLAGRLAWARPAAPPSPGIGRPLLAAALVVGLAGFGAWTATAAAIGGKEIVDSASTWANCGTPASVFGWAYEAVNYDQLDDARLLAVNRGQLGCEYFGTRAGEEVMSRDGVHVAGWYIPAAIVGPHGPTIVIVPGWKSHKSEVLKYAPPFHDAYDVLVVDLRHGGRSDRALATWGVDDQLDVRAMIDWLERTKGPGWIGVTGNSMGAATALAEAAGDPRVRALVLDSMHASMVDSITDGIGAEWHLPGVPAGWTAVAAASLMADADLTSVDPARMIARLSDRPVLLIHGTADVLDRPERSAEVNLAAARTAGVPVELHYCLGGTHGQVIDRCPAEWAAWATGFLARVRASAAATGR
jgi:alpha/beta hydrolase fold